MKLIKERFFTPTLATSLIVASCLVIVGMCTYLVLKPPVAKRSSVETQQFNKSGVLIKNYNISYPTFRVEKVDVTLRNYTIHKVNEFLKRFGTNNPKAYLTVGYSILHYDSKTVTVLFREKIEEPSTPHDETHALMTFDLETQKQLTLGDIFKERGPAQTLIARLLHDYFKYVTPGVLSYQEQKNLQQFTFTHVRDYILDDDAIILYLNPQALGSEKEQATISIKKEVLHGTLRDMYASVSPSTTRNIEPPTYAINTLPPTDKAIDPNGKMIALTFDDGPGVLTSQLLDALKQYGVRATFFVIGRQVPTYESTVRREAVEGHEIGNHSWAHPNLTRLPPEQLQQQINDTQQAVKNATGGYVPKVVRPPEGAYNENVLAFLRTLGLSVELWNVDTQDWLYRDTQVVYNRIMASAADGRVILLHDIHQSSVDAALRAIPELVSQGYQLVTISELHQYR